MREEELREKLQDKVWQLSQIIAIASKIHSTLDLDSVLEGFLRTSTSELGGVAAGIYLKRSGRLALLKQFGFERITNEAAESARVVANELAELSDPNGDQRGWSAIDLEDAAGLSQLLSVVLRNEQTEVMGVLQLIHQRDGAGDDYVGFLRRICHFISLAIQNAEYHEQSLAKARLDEEMRVAKQIQCRTLPRRSPAISGFEVESFFLPCHETAGDYYHYFERNGIHYLVLMDVSGKGVGAAMVAHSIHSVLSLKLGSTYSLSELAASMSQFLYSTLEGEKYATGAFLEISEDGAVSYLSAGHTSILIVGPRGVARLSSTGPPVGLLPGLPFEHLSVPMEPGDLLCVYSDGYSEAFDENDNEFGEERLEQALVGLQDLELPSVLRGINDAVDRFKGAVPDQDDRTLLLLRKL